MTGPDETANLAGEITRAYREHPAGEARALPVPGRVLGGDIEGQADALADAAARLGELLTVFAQELRRSLDVIAVFCGLSRSAESMAAAAAELRRQDWFGPRGRDGSGGCCGVEGRARRPAVRSGHVRVGR